MRAVITLVLFSTSICIATPNDVPPDFKDLEAHILASRRTIKSGKFVVQVRSNKPEEDHDYSIWQAEDGRIRQEREYAGEHQVSIIGKDFAYYYAALPGMFMDPDLTQRPTIERLPIAEVKLNAL